MSVSQFKRIRERIGQDHWRIARGMMVVAFFVLFGKIAGAGKEIGIAWKYGVGEVIDVYVLTFVIVIWLPSVLTSALNAVYVPLSRKLDVGSRERFAAELSGAIFLVGVFLSIAFILVVAPLLPNYLDGFTSTKKLALSASTAMLAPVIFLMFLTAMLSARLLAEEKHVNTLLESVPALVILFAVFLVVDASSVKPLIYATLLGQTLQLLFLIYIVYRAGLGLKFKFRFQHPKWRLFFNSFGVLIVGTFVMSGVPLVDQYLASGLGDGSVSTLNYATKLLALGLGLGATAISRAILPVLSDSESTVARRLELAKRWAIILLVGGCAAAVLGWFCSEFAVRLLFERGAFSIEDTIRVSVVVQYGLSQLPFYFSSIVLVQLFASVGLYRAIAISSVIALAVKITVGSYLANHYGVNGIALSTGIMYLINSAYFVWIFSRAEFPQGIKSGSIDKETE